MLDTIEELLNPSPNDDQELIDKKDKPDLSLTQYKKDIEDLKEAVKNQQELIRQQSETNKELQSFKNRIVGNTEADKFKEELIIDEQEYDKDPTAYVKTKIEAGIAAVEERFKKKEIKNSVNKAALEIAEKYDVNFDRDYPKIVKELNRFSIKDRQENPKRCLLDACRLAKVIKRKDSGSAQIISGSGMRTVTPAQLDEAAQIKKRFLKGGRKSDNVFGI